MLSPLPSNLKDVSVFSLIRVLSASSRVDGKPSAGMVFDFMGNKRGKFADSSIEVRPDSSREISHPRERGRERERGRGRGERERESTILGWTLRTNSAYSGPTDVLARARARARVCVLGQCGFGCGCSVSVCEGYCSQNHQNFQWLCFTHLMRSHSYTLGEGGGLRGGGQRRKWALVLFSMGRLGLW